MSSLALNTMASACYSFWSSASRVAGRDFTNTNYDEIVYVISGRAKWIVGNEERGAETGDVLRSKSRRTSQVC
jgi:mannose-6-phosphate isomerase-like protein (cupin superfamily)